MIRKTIFILCVVIFFPLSAFAERVSWNLPQDLSEKNVKINFSVDTTWHLVHGEAKAIGGRVWLEDENVDSSIRAQINIAVNKLDTALESRDKKMHKVMNATEFPEVKFDLTSAKDLCSFEELKGKKSCDVVLAGVLGIRGVSKELSLPASVSLVGDEIKVLGKVSIDWSEFGVEDPSIIIARVKREVIINFEVLL